MTHNSKFRNEKDKKLKQIENKKNEYPN